MGAGGVETRGPDPSAVPCAVVGRAARCVTAIVGCDAVRDIDHRDAVHRHDPEWWRPAWRLLLRAVGGLNGGDGSVSGGDLREDLSLRGAERGWRRTGLTICPYVGR